MKVWKQLVVTVAAGALAFILTACGQTPPEQMEKRVTEQAGNPFSANATIHYQGLTSKVEVDKDIPVRYTLTFLEPKALAGMKVVLEEENVSIDYGSLSLKVDPNQLSSSAAVKLLASAVNAVTSDSGVEVTVEDDAVKLQGVMDSGEFTLCMDKKTGNFLSLTVPGSDFSMEFSGFSFF